MEIIESYGTYTLVSNNNGQREVRWTTLAGEHREMVSSNQIDSDPMYTFPNLIAVDTYNGVNAVVFEIADQYEVYEADETWQFNVYVITATLGPQQTVNAFGPVIPGYTPETSNEAPTAINLSNSDIAEKSNGAVVGTLSVTDPDTDDTHSLTLSGYHAGLFEVSNNQLKLRSGVSADYETQSSYSVTVTATDSGGLSKSQDFTIGDRKSTRLNSSH